MKRIIICGESLLCSWCQVVGASPGFFKRGATLSKWGFLPGCHVVFAYCCRLFAKKGLQKGVTGTQGLPSYAPVAFASVALGSTSLTCFVRSNLPQGLLVILLVSRMFFFLMETNNELDNQVIYADFGGFYIFGQNAKLLWTELKTGTKKILFPIWLREIELKFTNSGRS